MSTQEKTCFKCNKTKTLQEFYRIKNGKFGRAAECKQCRSEYYKKHNARLSTKDKKKARFDNNKEKAIKKRQEYYQKNKDTIRKKQQERRINSPEYKARQEEKRKKKENIRINELRKKKEKEEKKRIKEAEIMRIYNKNERIRIRKQKKLKKERDELRKFAKIRDFTADEMQKDLDKKIINRIKNKGIEKDNVIKYIPFF